MEKKKVIGSGIGTKSKTPDTNCIGKNVCESNITNKPKDPRPVHNYNTDNVPTFKVKEKHIMATSRLRPKTSSSSAVLIPSVSQRKSISAVCNFGDSILHPELVISPRSGDIINRRGIFYIGKHQRLTIGSIGAYNTKGNPNIQMHYEEFPTNLYRQSF